MSSVVEEFLVSISLNKPPCLDSFPWTLGGLEEAGHCEGGAEGQEGGGGPLPGQHERPGWGQEGKATGCAVFGSKTFLSD